MYKGFTWFLTAKAPRRRNFIGESLTRYRIPERLKPALLHMCASVDWLKRKRNRERKQKTQTEAMADGNKIIFHYFYLFLCIYVWECAVVMIKRKRKTKKKTIPASWAPNFKQFTTIPDQAQGIPAKTKTAAITAIRTIYVLQRILDTRHYLR